MWQPIGDGLPPVQLCGVFYKLFTMSLSLQRIPVLWKMSLLAPVPKMPRPSVPQDYRPVAFISDIVQTLDWSSFRSELNEATSGPPSFCLPTPPRSSERNYLLNHVYAIWNSGWALWGSFFFFFRTFPVHSTSSDRPSWVISWRRCLSHVRDYRLPGRKTTICLTSWSATPGHHIR